MGVNYGRLSCENGGHKAHDIQEAPLSLDKGDENGRDDRNQTCASGICFTAAGALPLCYISMARRRGIEPLTVESCYRALLHTLPLSYLRIFRTPRRGTTYETTFIFFLEQVKVVKTWHGISTIGIRHSYGGTYAGRALPL
jgi:hypothetical protein